MEIKFRGKSKKTSEWLIGSYIKNRGLDFIAPDEFANGKTWEDYNVAPDTVGMYIGKKDRNGKEIYEGDIIDFVDAKWRKKYQERGYVNDRHVQRLVVIWNESGFGLTTPDEVFLERPNTCGIEFISEGFVVGNIYDNKELLKVHE